MGITGVPFFVFDGKLGISGAQPPETFLEVFQKLAAKNDEATVSANGTNDGEGISRC